MTLREFRNLVRTEFGGDLRNMTPANARGFLDRVQTRVDGGPTPGERIQLAETEVTYEGIVRDFLRQALELPADAAVIRLWLFCLELASASVLDLESERFRKLFAGMSAEGPD